MAGKAPAQGMLLHLKISWEAARVQFIVLVVVLFIRIVLLGFRSVYKGILLLFYLYRIHNITDFKAVNIAEQMTLVDAELYNRIEVS